MADENRYANLSPEEREFQIILDSYDEQIKYIQERIDSPLSDTPVELRPSVMKPLRGMGTKNVSKIEGREEIKEINVRKDEFIAGRLEAASPSMRLKYAELLYQRETEGKTEREVAPEEKGLDASQGYLSHKLYKAQSVEEKGPGKSPAIQSPPSYERPLKEIARENILDIERGEYND